MRDVTPDEDEGAASAQFGGEGRCLQPGDGTENEVEAATSSWSSSVCLTCFWGELGDP